MIMRYVVAVLSFSSSSLTSLSTLRNRNGLRDTPSFVVNVMTQWANILIYFELPSWIKNWDNIAEEADDHDDVKALKVILWMFGCVVQASVRFALKHYSPAL